jgi:hypothetical protein
MNYTKQNDLLLDKLQKYYETNNFKQLDKILKILNGDSIISLRILDWFVTNYAQKNYVVYSLTDGSRFKVYNDYKLKLKAYSKKRFDPFCRWEKITIPYKNNTLIQTTIGQLNFFKWVLENEIIEYIESNFDKIEIDMNTRNSTSKKKPTEHKTRKTRHELSPSAIKNIQKEFIQISVNFD